MSSQKQSVEVHFGSSAHPSGGLRFGSQPRDGGDQQQAKARGDQSEAEATPAG